MTLGVGLLIELNEVLILHSNCPVSHLLGSSYIYWWESGETYKLRPAPKFSHLNSYLSICPPCYKLTSLYHDLLKVTRALKVFWNFKWICLPIRITAKIFSKSLIITLKNLEKSHSKFWLLLPVILSVGNQHCLSNGLSPTITENCWSYWWIITNCSLK